MERKEGYYKVQYKKSGTNEFVWQVCYWDGRYWDYKITPYGSGPLTDSNFTQIYEERIIMPDEKKSELEKFSEEFSKKQLTPEQIIKYLGCDDKDNPYKNTDILKEDYKKQIEETNKLFAERGNV